jgi:deoxyadenosine/deoxycytidine kinase
MLMNTLLGTGRAAASQVRIFSVEGNIGAGKSTLLAEVARLHAERERERGGKLGFELRTVSEPIEDWTTPVLPNGQSMLQAFYHPQQPSPSPSPSTSEEAPAASSNNAMAFQMFAMLARLQQMREATAVQVQEGASASQRPVVVVTERGPWSDAELFGVPMHEGKLLTDAEWHAYSAWHAHARQLWQPEGTVYLRSTPDKSAQRINLRSRRGEEAIDPAYLEKLHATHEAYIARLPDAYPTLVLDGNTDGPECIRDKAAALLEFIDEAALPRCHTPSGVPRGT